MEFGLVWFGLVWFGLVWWPVSWLVSSVSKLVQYVMLQISKTSWLLPSNFYQLDFTVNPVPYVRFRTAAELRYLAAQCTASRTQPNKRQLH